MSMVCYVYPYMKVRCEMEANYIWRVVNVHHGRDRTQYGFTHNIDEVYSCRDNIPRTEQWMMIPSWKVFERASL